MIIILVLACGQNPSEKKLNGKWYGIENDGYTRMHFYSDSLLFTEEFKESTEWNATESKIEFSLPNNMFTDSSKSVTVYYKFSNGKDILFSNFETLYGENKLNFLKAKNYIEYLNKRYEVEFSLPEDNSLEFIETEAIYGLNVFMGYSNNKVVGRTEFSKNLNHLESDIKIFKDSIKPYTQHQKETHEILLDRRFHLRIFADKSISDTTITKYLQVTIKRENSTLDKYYPEEFKGIKRDTLPIKIYRIYQSEEKLRLGNMKGKIIKTIANTVYN